MKNKEIKKLEDRMQQWSAGNNHMREIQTMNWIEFAQQQQTEVTLSLLSYSSSIHPLLPVVNPVSSQPCVWLTLEELIACNYSNTLLIKPLTHTGAHAQIQSTFTKDLLCCLMFMRTFQLLSHCCQFISFIGIVNNFGKYLLSKTEMRNRVDINIMSACYVQDVVSLA